MTQRERRKDEIVAGAAEPSPTGRYAAGLLSRKIRGEVFMATAEGDADDVLTCPKCGGKTMFIRIEEDDVQSIRCASCQDLVAYTSELIRVFKKP
jgi:hypothetical protein